jgi:hypothetical protein
MNTKSNSFNVLINSNDIKVCLLVSNGPTEVYGLLDPHQARKIAQQLLKAADDAESHQVQLDRALR